jgi:formimidoylglutamate deiminase
MRIVAKQALLPTGWAQDVAVEITEGRIGAIGAGQDHTVDVLLPAPVNLHSHAFQRAMAGLTEFRTSGQDSFWTWRTLMYRFLDHLTPDDVEAIAAQVMVEMAEAGYAAVAEFHYLHHGLGGQTYSDVAEMAGRIAAASCDTGLGLTLLPVLYERGGCDGRALQGGQLRFGNDINRFLDLHQAASGHLTRPDDRIGVAPHSLRAVRPESLAHLPKGPIHIHVAEQLAEVAEVQAHMGARPVEWVLNHGADADWCLIHATQMTAQETENLAKSGAVAGLCPITEANLGDGIFDGARYLAAQGAFGIGSDSNIRISLSEEIRMLEYSQRLGMKARAVLADASPEAGRSVGRVIFDGMVKGGAQAAGRQSGAIAVGQWADLLALDASGPDMAGRKGDRVLDTFAFAGDDRMVSDLWSAGRHIVTQGRHIARDAVRQRFARVMARLAEAL